MNTVATPVQASRRGTHSPKYIRWFEEISIDDVPVVGGKNASLGEMYRELSASGVKVPNGFAITAQAYRDFLSEAGLDRFVIEQLAGLDSHDVEQLRERAGRIRHAILEAPLPRDLIAQTAAAYQQLSESQQHADVAVRSSATAEDLPDASFAGQQETYLNVQGELALLYTCKRSFASLFTERAISYRVDKGFDHSKVALSIGVQKMVRSDLAASGVLFTIDTETGFRDAVLINAAYGLGENVVQGSVNPRRSHGKECSRVAGRTRPIRDLRRGDSSTGALGLHHRGTLLRQARPADADGHRVGEGWKHGRTVHCAGAAGDGAVAEGA